ncbi:GNAT family N-acetyltransferase [Piscinibacter terrae]|uniref:GNAT family N-acetyltransferase n=1 Tax=Piscinibacter terrae TaxID=2496871 RepID=A0A3N7JUG8_9BURK|nr:GNAT family N-acetyltransferase [Albitalea terrae]RQP22565.1 GNAT family N-acetyltransferase [Albitalea terrae]
MTTLPPIAITSFEPSHIPQARALWQQSDGVGLSSADEPPALSAFLARNPGLSFVAWREGEVVGTILCGHDGRRGLIHHLVVAESCRRLGLGRLLLRHGLSGLAREGIEKAHLLVFQSNESGKAFWRTVGAEDRSSVLALFSIAT